MRLLDTIDNYRTKNQDLMMEISDNNIDRRLQLGFSLLNQSIYGSSRTNQDRLGQSND